MKLHFLGGVGTVTGSKYLLEGKRQKILIDCGLYQGYKLLRQRNWKAFPYPVEKIDAVILTHAHLDHSGYLPALVARGFKGRVYTTKATRDLCEILLLDSAHLQEEEARYANKKGSSKHKPALPLYDTDDVEKALQRFETVDFDKPISLGDWQVSFVPSGHILGASSLRIEAEGKTIAFSGDIGRQSDIVMAPPASVGQADVLVMESTYGDRLHATTDVKTLFADIINETAAKGGSVLIPSFAVGRAQVLMHLLTELRTEEKIPPLPIYLNSPMAIDVAELYCRYHHQHRLDAQSCRKMSEHVRYTRSVEESIALVAQSMPSIIISASGMATGGRVLHHLKKMLPDPIHTIVFAGYQAPGTRGWRLVEGESSIKLFGQYHAVKARVESIDMLSAHADQAELIDWAGSLKRQPKQLFLTHGEDHAVDTLRIAIKAALGWDCEIPEYREVVTL